MDDDFGVVKEEIVEEDCPLPCFNGRVVSWLVSADGGSVLSDADTGSQCGQSDALSSLPPGAERGPGVGETRPPSFHGGQTAAPGEVGVGGSLVQEGSDGFDPGFDDTESGITSVSQIGRRRPGGQGNRMPLHGGRTHQLRAGGGHYASSVLSSEIETTSFFDTEDNESMASSRFTTSTEATSVSRQHANRMRKQKRHTKRKQPHLSRASSISSVTDSTLSLNIITVTLNMDTVNFLGISIVGQSNQAEGGDGGIYVGSIMKGGAVALDGRIDPGDMILQVNEISFDNMSNDDAVKVLKDVVQKPGPIRLVVAKSWDPAPSSHGRAGGLTLPSSDPVRPIDPGAWVAHTAAIRALHPESVLYGDLVGVSSRDPLLGDFPGRAPSMTTLSASSVASSHPETEKYLGIHHNKPPQTTTTVDAPVNNQPLTKNSGMPAIINRLRKPDSGLEVKDRTWLKLQIPHAFIGSELVQWLCTNVEGFEDRKEARKYAVLMLKEGFIKDTVNKATFSEQCYYTFNPNLSEGLGRVNLNESKLSNESANHLEGPTMTTDLPLPSGGSGGSAGGIWGAGMTSQPQQPSAPQAWDMPWTGPPSGGGGSTTTYGPIYNPAAPPPSAAYGMSLYPGYGGQPPPSSSGSGSHRSNTRLMLAGSGSG